MNLLCPTHSSKSHGLLQKDGNGLEDESNDMEANRDHSAQGTSDVKSQLGKQLNTNEFMDTPIEIQRCRPQLMILLKIIGLGFSKWKCNNNKESVRSVQMPLQLQRFCPLDLNMSDIITFKKGLYQLKNLTHFITQLSPMTISIKVDLHSKQEFKSLNKDLVHVKISLILSLKRQGLIIQVFF